LLKNKEAVLTKLAVARQFCESSADQRKKRSNYRVVFRRNRLQYVRPASWLDRLDDYLPKEKPQD